MSDGLIPSLEDVGGANNAYGANGRRRKADPNSKHYASDTYANVHRDQWDDYQTRFMPLHGVIDDAMMGSKLVDEQLGRVNDNVSTAFGQAETAMNADRSRMGLESIEVDDGLAKVKAVGHAKNNIRSAGEQRKETAFTGTANSVLPSRGT